MSWASEMETLILGWYILSQTKSVALLGLFASLQFMGTLIAPIFGLAGDKLGHRNILRQCRVLIALLAIILLAFSAANALSVATVLVVSFIGGLIRPSDTGLRTVLMSESMPAENLMPAIGLSRITSDSARVAGALLGTAAVALVGMTWAYVVIVALYVGSAMLLSGVSVSKRDVVSTSSGTPWQELKVGARAVWESQSQLAAMLLAFLVNLTAYPFTLGLLPYLAKQVYGLTEVGLGYISASAGAGAIAASLLLSRIGAFVRPGRMMIASALVWYVTVILLGFSTNARTGSILLFANGFASMFCLLPLSLLLVRGSAPALRGRIMGLRTQAVYGLPLGLLVSGPLIESVGFQATTVIYGACGITCLFLIFFTWRRHLWPLECPANNR